MPTCIHLSLVWILGGANTPPSTSAYFTEDWETYLSKHHADLMRTVSGSAATHRTPPSPHCTYQPKLSALVSPGARGPHFGKLLCMGSLGPKTRPFPGPLLFLRLSKHLALGLLSPRVFVGNRTPAAGLWRWNGAVREQGTESPSCFGGAVPTPCLSDREMDAAQLPRALGMRWASR